MNRFFSKLDLRDIKIDPEDSHFPPDADEVELEPDDETVLEAEVVPDLESHDHGDRPVEAPRQSAWSSAATAVDEPAPQHYPNGLEVDNAPVTPANLPVSAAVVRVETSGEVLKVSARSRPSAVAGAIAGVVRECGRAEVQAIGAGATNQAVKAVAIARDYLRETDIEAVCLPEFIDIMIENEERTAIRLVVEPR